MTETVVKGTRSKVVADAYTDEKVHLDLHCRSYLLNFCVSDLDCLGVHIRFDSFTHFASLKEY